jgi:predicted deacetylase
VSFERFLFDFVTRVEFLQLKRYLVFLHLGIIVFVVDVSPENVEFIVLVIDQLDYQLLTLLLINPNLLERVQILCELEQFFCKLLVQCTVS